MEDLTRRQRAIYEFVVEQVRSRGMPPTLMEIARAFGLSSAAGVADHLKAIERKGYIRRQPGASRGIQIAAEVSRARRRSVRIPVLGSVPGGDLRVPAEAERYLLFDGRVAAGEAFAVRARLEGLERRGILRDDYLIVRRGLRPRRGELGLARCGDRILLVEGRSRGAARVLMERSAPDGDGAELLGRVIAVLRAFDEIE